MLQNDFFKHQYITFNATIPGQDRIHLSTHLCRTFLLGIFVPVIDSDAAFLTVCKFFKTMYTYIVLMKDVSSCSAALCH